MDHKLNDIKEEYEVVYSYNSYKPSKEHIDTLKKINSKKVVQYDLDMNIIGEFPSAREAARYIGRAETNLSKVCRLHKGTCGGYMWRYADDLT